MAATATLTSAPRRRVRATGNSTGPSRGERRLARLRQRCADRYAPSLQSFAVGSQMVVTGSRVRAGYGPDYYKAYEYAVPTAFRPGELPTYARRTERPIRTSVVGVLRAPTRGERLLMREPCVVVEVGGQRELYRISGLTTKGGIFEVLA
jgi:hypothetical protein